MPNGPPLIQPAAETLINQLQIGRDRLAIHVTEGYFLAHPECWREDMARIRRLCHEDLGYHIDHLASALALGDATSFGAYMLWLRSALEHRGLDLAHPVDSFRLMQAWIEREIEHPQVAQVLVLLEYAVALLEAPSAEVPEQQGDALVALSRDVEQYAQVLIAGQRREVTEQLLAAMDAGASLVDVSVDLIQPALYQVGLLWQQNRITVAQEHLATALVQNALAAGFAKAVFEPPNGRRAVFACIEGNHHLVGLRMVSDAFEVAGWEVDFLGGDTPTPSIIAFVAQRRPELLGLSVSLGVQVLKLREVIARVKAELGNESPAIVAGGRALNIAGVLPKRLGADEILTDARSAVQCLG